MSRKKHKKSKIIMLCRIKYVTLPKMQQIADKPIMTTPKMAIIDPNTLAVLGLKQLIQQVMPVMEIDTFGSMAELTANHPEEYVHFFAAMNIVLENRAFFQQYRRKTIVLTLSLEGGSQLTEFHSVCVNVPEKELVRSLLAMYQSGHSDGRNLPLQHPTHMQQSVLSDRETEVMSLIVQGYKNKEIADRLCIGLSTVVTHRKNIMEKLNIKSVSALTVYAVTHGYVDINKI